jgi:diaminopimelate epimerase
MERVSTAPTAPRAAFAFLKGHGTENDFVIVPDPDNAMDLPPGVVAALCDRRAGIGGDGLLHVVRSAVHPEARGMAAEAEWFMDYRNADGSVAEMCGNGVRVFLRYLQRLRLVEHSAAVATRGGIVCVRSDSNGDITVAMGVPRVLADRPVVTAAPALERGCLATVAVPNPHVVVEIQDEAELAELDLARAPVVQPALPDGQNVEFVLRKGTRHLAMRVHERGSGETRSCGTGICAVVVAVATADGSGADGSRWRVDVPGGTCTVRWLEGGIELTGPAVIVAELELDDAWLEGAAALAR